MQQDSTLNPSLEQEQQIAELEQQLSEAAVAQGFKDTPYGELAVRLATLQIDKLVKDICSDKYLEDHRGYVNAVARLQARRDWLKSLTGAASHKRVAKIEERLEILNGQ